ncbi:hypothetical protein, partial [Brooklawnia cerclae]
MATDDAATQIAASEDEMATRVLPAVGPGPETAAPLPEPDTPGPRQPVVSGGGLSLLEARGVSAWFGSHR